MTPSVGRVVHYVSAGSADGRYPSVCRAAIITEVHNPEYVNLCVFNPEGLHFPKSVPYVEVNATLKPYSWHWPERVE